MEDAAAHEHDRTASSGSILDRSAGGRDRERNCASTQYREDRATFSHRVSRVLCVFVVQQVPEYDQSHVHGLVLTTNGPTSGLACVFASGPSSAATPRAMAAVSLPAWKQVKSGRSRHASGPHNRTPALSAASWTILIARS